MFKTLDKRIRRVVRSGNCSGCGACCQLDPGLRMELDDRGYLRPVRVMGISMLPGVDHLNAGRRFERVCPGVGLRAADRAREVLHHPTLGPYVSCWVGHASDAEARFSGASGGVLTALAAWLLEQNIAASVIGVAPSTADPRRTVPVSISTKAEALRSAGSRYAPVSVAASPALRQGKAAMVAKPCEIAALRRLVQVSDQIAEPPVLLSFFCAGTPSQTSTDNLVATLVGAQPGPLRSMWYRGKGWPGRFTVVTDAGSRDMSYEDSWGGHLGRSIQWRCKVCIDGTGESADIAAGDFWGTDRRGYPLFDEAEGISAVIARTHKGHDLLMAARKNGVVQLSTVAPDAIMRVQPLQRARRLEMSGRLLGTLAAGRRVPRYRGYGLARTALRHPRMQWSAARATRWRLRQRAPGPPG